MKTVKEDGMRCPIASAVDLFNGRWKTSILWHLVDAPKRFNEIRRLLPQISSRMLTKALRELERDGLLMRQVTFTSPVKVYYSKTELTETLIDIFKNLDTWQEVNMKSVYAARQQYDALNA
ncbi:MAG: helix-turn-helix domain-containing protein [Bacteroidota bacterium]